jgi:hypothetical protein
VCYFAIVKITDVREQRNSIKFCFKLGMTAAETHKLLQQTSCDNALGLTETNECFRRFKKGPMSVHDDKRSGRQSTGATTENEAKVREAILDDRRQTIHDVCDIVKLSYGMCQSILLHELNKLHTAAKSVPKLLSNDQKKHHLAVRFELMEQTEKDLNFILYIITGDASCIYRHDPEAQQHYLNGRLKIHQDLRKHKFKTMSISCFGSESIVHRELICTHRYWKLLLQYSEAAERKRPVQTSSQVAGYAL